jgi:hypothetical protein
MNARLNNDIKAESLVAWQFSIRRVRLRNSFAYFKHTP